MSFQGNVAGMGLAEVLQSIGRGDKVGVLHLETGERSARLGMKGGHVFLLPGVREDDDQWRRRCQQAWADDPQPGLEARRREVIARAARLECLYQLLEAPNVHFQFVPGSLDAWDAGSDDQSSPWGPGIPVEYLLLEHARLSDESHASAHGAVSAWDMPRALDAGARADGTRTLLSHCDGSATLCEIADRLGWTLTQARASLSDHLEQGAVRLAHPHEVLAQAQRELERGRHDRAATRLGGWNDRSAPGPIGPAERACLQAEWEAGRLEEAFALMRQPQARALLRRLDIGEENPEDARHRWEALGEAAPGVTLTMIRTFVWRRRAEAPCEASTMTELLRQARSFQEKQLLIRARTILRLVASHVPEKLSTRLELGARLIDSGLVKEGSRWLVDGARELIESRQPERALQPLRTVLDTDPGHREAHGLLIETHAHSVRRRRRRTTSLVGLAAVLLLGAAAVVRVRGEQEFERRLSEVTDNMDRPAVALTLLEQHFQGEGPERVSTLRANLQRRMREEAQHDRAMWLARFAEVRQLCELGDPLLALTQTLELSDPPPLDGSLGPWPSRAELFNTLASHLSEQCEQLVLPTDASVEEMHAEQRLAAELEQVLERIEGHLAMEGAEAFRFRIEQLRGELLSRRDRRAQEREHEIEREMLAEQDLTLAAARSHAAARDLLRAMAAYDRLFASEQDPRERATLVEIYGPEADAVRAHHAAYLQALDLAQRGEHERAFEVLRPHIANLGEHLLPWRIESDPSGAHVTTSQGDERATPLVLQSGFGEPVTISVELDGHEPVTLSVDRPGDLDLHLHRLAERTWTSGHRVEAMPVPSGPDHVLADRAGHLARLDAGGRTLWESELPTLGGVARTPVFLGRRPGHLLVLTEDGEAWVVDASTGREEGPWDAGSPPIEGPLLTRSGVSARFADGRVAVWTAAVEPEVFQGVDTIPEKVGPRDASAMVGSLQALRRGADAGMVLHSRWTDWRVEVFPDEYRVARGGEDFTVRRDGEWVFVAWEDKSALIPQGRLWVSDAGGLRSYLPGRP